MKNGYMQAQNLAGHKLSVMRPEEVCARCGARWDGESYIVPWLSRDARLAESVAPHSIIWLHYLISEGTGDPAGELMPYRDAPGARFYERNFIWRAVMPFVKCFGSAPQAFLDIASSLGGSVSESVEGGVTITALPKVPLTFILRPGDDEFPPDGTILFDKTAKGWFCAEDLVVLASLCSYELIGEFKKRRGI